jgi:dihydropteroate synthase
VEAAITAGADIIDIGGVKAGPGEDVSSAEERSRVAGFVQQVRERHPNVIISVDTWRSEVALAACEAGADIINDAWGGYDPSVAEVAAEYHVGLVCTHAGGVTPRSRPHRVEYEDVTTAVRAFLIDEMERVVALGVDRQRVLVDPGHDFAKNTRHSLQLTARLSELTTLGAPLLVSLSNKDFIGETLDKAVPERLVGTLAATAVSAWLGAQVFRAHQVAETQQVLQMVQAIRGRRQPLVSRRGLS